MDGEENQEQEIEIRPYERDFDYTVGDLTFGSGEQCNKYGPTNNCPDVFKIKVTNNNKKYRVRFNMLLISNYWMSPPEQRIEKEYTLNRHGKPESTVVLPLCPIPPHCMEVLRQTHSYYLRWQERLKIVEDETQDEVQEDRDGHKNK
jgi:hypothetical protein